MSNSDEDAKQKQWEARNSDRRDTFEGVTFGTRTGEVRTIDYQERPLLTFWTADAQFGSDGTVSDDPVAIRHTHVWPSDVEEPSPGQMVFAESHQAQVASNGNGWADGEENGNGEWWTCETVYVPAADG